MTALAAELDQKLAQLAPERAAQLERAVRNVIALVDDTDAGVRAVLNTKTEHVALSTEDFEQLCDALDRPPRELPRLRRLMQGIADA